MLKYSIFGVSIGWLHSQALADDGLLDLVDLADLARVSEAAVTGLEGGVTRSSSLSLSRSRMKSDWCSL